MFFLIGNISKLFTILVDVERKMRIVEFKDNVLNIYILLDVLLCSIAEYFYELCP